ncbi:uncharacterized protein LOC113147616 [Cyclospora cayetanensis]|uniref:Uncharacterized protein LOC113147616 n=1 Tax=Cyclospora cayetanensis TaxID=88456 RepID=A0A6P6S303_9EIME|nr:uncharacterized protein LOC113147616 [Cyclospora cayetanensis]
MASVKTCETSPLKGVFSSPSMMLPREDEGQAAASPYGRISNTDTDGNGCYLVTLGLCAHVHAKNAQAAAAAAADAAAGAAAESGRSESAKIGSLYISSVPAQHPQQADYHHEQQLKRRHQEFSPTLQLMHRHEQQVQQKSQQQPSYCSIRVENPHAYGNDSAATEAVISAVARAAAAEISMAAEASEVSSLCGDLPVSPEGPPEATAAHGIVGVNMPDLKNIPMAIRVPPYREHLVYELKQLRRFWRIDLHQRDWRQVFVSSYFPNVIDPLLLTILRFLFCCCVLVLECFASIQGYAEVGKAQMLYFTNWNSLLVAAGFLSLTITSITACKSFAAPLQHVATQEDDQQQHHQGLQPQSELLMNPVDEPPRVYPRQQPQKHTERFSASRENSSCSLGFSALEFVAVDGRHPRPTYSSNKSALLPWLVQQRQQLLRQKQPPRDTRAVCLVLPGYRDLMADSRYCVEGILLAPNPSNMGKLVQDSVAKEGCDSMCCLKAKKSIRSYPASPAQPAIMNAAPSQAVTACHSSAADSDPTCRTGSRCAVDLSTDVNGIARKIAGTTISEIPWFVKLTWIIHNLQLVASLGVFAVYFSLFKAEDVAFPGSWVTVWKHAVLVFLTLLHASLLSRIPCPLRHMGFTLILFLLYFIVQLCVFFFDVPNGQGGSGYVYKVFCLSEPSKAVFVLSGILLCCALLHIFLFSISRKRCLYVDPPPSVSVTALQLKRSIRYAAAAAAAAAAAEQMVEESSSSAAAAAAQELTPKDSRVCLDLRPPQCYSEEASTGHPDGRHSGSTTRRDDVQSGRTEVTARNVTGTGLFPCVQSLRHHAKAQHRKRRQNPGTVALPWKCNAQDCLRNAVEPANTPSPLAFFR